MQHALRFVLILVLSASGPALAQGSFVNFETAPVHTLRVSESGKKLFVLNTPDARLAVFSLADPDRPRLVKEIPVGLEPISLTERNRDEVWVVNSLSDSVSIVSLSKGRVIDTIYVKDEPADVAFAGHPERAFVSVSASDEVRVFDAATRAPLGKIPVFGKDPRAMVAHDGRVYALIHRSGNRTAIMPVEHAPPPMKPRNEKLPPAPPQSLIIDLDETKFADVSNRLPDYDIFEIDADSLEITRRITSVGTVNFDMALDPSTGDLLVAHIESRNHIPFEPDLRGHCIDSRVTRVTLGAEVGKTFMDLNPQIDYDVLPNPEGRATALAEITGIVVSPDGGRIYVAAHGTDRIGVLDRSGRVLHRIDVGDARGDEIDTRHIRGPRALSLNPRTDRLYVHNHLSHTLSVIDTQRMRVLREQPVGHDPMPPKIRAGRRFLYDAKLAGNGTMSCASCHIDGDVDLLAWDLGDPGGEMKPIPGEQLIFTDIPTEHHPMKGPMLTQSLRGLKDVEPFHWRGDRPDLQTFNIAFDKLMGGAELSQEDIDLYAHFQENVQYPPNPNQKLDRTLKDLPADRNALAGQYEFHNGSVFDHDLDGQTLHCVTCHARESGSNPLLLPPPDFFAVILQPTRIGVLRNLYRRQGATANGPSKAGFGYLHDGRYDTLDTLVHTPEFSGIKDEKRDDIIEYLLAFDTGTAPAVGYEVTVDAARAGARATAEGLDLLESQAGVQNCDVIAKGTIDGVARGFAYDADLDSYLADRLGEGPFVRDDLLGLVRAGRASLVFTGVPPGSGRRLGIDRDLDGRLDRDDGLSPYGIAHTSSSEALALDACPEPRLGHEVSIVTDVKPGRRALLVGSLAPAPVAGIDTRLLVDAREALVFVEPMAQDGEGLASIVATVPRDPALLDTALYVQALVCGPDRAVRTSNGLRLTVAR